MRATHHNGRVGKDGTFSAKHNDRNYDITKDDHIDQERSSKNWYWHIYAKNAPNLNFEQAEAKFYDETFKMALNAKNERYRASGHKERMKSMDQYRKNRLSCPEESILQVGKLGETIDSVLLQRMYVEYAHWCAKEFPQVRILDAALHVDEQGAPHIHERKVWIAKSKDGLIVGQAKALKQMGIERPNPDKPEGRYNNAKMTYTERCRKHWIDICHAHGLNIEREPEKASKRGLELLEYQRKQEQEKAEQAIQEAEQARLEVESLKRQLEAQNEEKKRLEEKLKGYNYTRREQLERQLLDIFVAEGKTKDSEENVIHVSDMWEKYLDLLERKNYPAWEELKALVEQREYDTEQEEWDYPELY